MANEQQSGTGMSMEEMDRMIKDLQGRLQEQERKDQAQRQQFGVAGGDLDQLGAQATDFGGASQTTQLAQQMGGAPEMPMTVQGAPPPASPAPPPAQGPPPFQQNPSGVAAFAQLTPEEMARFRSNPY